MKAFLSFVVALGLFLLCQTFVDASLEEICKRIRPVPDHNISTYDFCVSSLQVNPRSRNASTRGLAIIASNLAKAKFAQNLARSRKLLKRNQLENIKDPLEFCVSYYRSGLRYIKAAIVEIKSQDISEASADLEDAVIAAAKCKESWIERNQTSLLLKENDDAYKISRLALGITDLLVEVHI